MSDNLANYPMTGCTTKAGLAAGTTTTLTTANLSLYALRGKAYTKAAASNAATPTLDALTGVAFLPVPAGTATSGGVEGFGWGTVFVVGYNAAGTLQVIQGSIEKTDSRVVASSTFQQTVPKFPILPDAFCPVGYIVTKTDSTASSWTFGASNLAGPPTGVLHTYTDCMLGLPDRPQAS
jgi:hypothetical protein